MNFMFIQVEFPVSFYCPVTQSPEVLQFWPSSLLFWKPYFYYWTLSPSYSCLLPGELWMLSHTGSSTDDCCGTWWCLMGNQSWPPSSVLMWVHHCHMCKTISFLSLPSCLPECPLGFLCVSMFTFSFNFHVLLPIPLQSSHKSGSLVGCPYSMAWYGKCFLCIIFPSVHTFIPYSGVPGLTELLIQYLIQPWWGAFLVQYGLLFSAGNNAIW